MFVRALAAELIKLRRTLALWMVFIAPLVVVQLQVFIILNKSGTPQAEAVDGTQLVLQNTFAFWLMLMLPLFITLETALLGGMEHDQHAWKHLYAQPTPRWAIYLAKQLVALGMIALSFLALMGFAWLAMAGMSALPLPSITWPQPPWAQVAQMLAYTFGMSWLMLALHLYVSVRWPSYTLSLGVGMVASVAGFLVDMGGSDSLAMRVFPWSLPLNGMMHFIGEVQVQMAQPLLLGMLGGVAVAALGAWHLSLRDAG